jgi:hypothetical protein
MPGPILGKYAGQALRAGCPPTFQKAEIPDSPLTELFGTLRVSQKGRLKFLFPLISDRLLTRRTEGHTLLSILGNIAFSCIIDTINI